MHTTQRSPTLQPPRRSLLPPHSRIQIYEKSPAKRTSDSTTQYPPLETPKIKKKLKSYCITQKFNNEKVEHPPGQHKTLSINDQR
jgi:hypothetical protein